MRTIILLDLGRLAYVTSDPLDGAELALLRGIPTHGDGPHVYAFQADEIIDHRTDPEPEQAELELQAGLGRIWETGGAGVEITTPLEAAWEQALKAYDLPDDGIAAWSLTLRQTEGTWEAEAWRSDTTSTMASGATGPSALRGLIARAPRPDPHEQQDG